MRIVSLLAAAVGVLAAGAVARGQTQPFLNAEQLEALATLQRSTVPPITADRRLLADVISRAIDRIVAAEGEGKIAAAGDLTEVVYSGKGAAAGQVSAMFRDLSSEVAGSVIQQRWAGLQEADWLSRMHVLRAVAPLAGHGPLIFRGLEAALDDPSPAVRYHAAKGMWPLRSAVISSAVSVVAQNRQEFLAAIENQALSETNGVVRRALYRLLLMQAPLPNPQNNQTVAALLKVAGQRLDTLAAAESLAGMPEGRFFEGADVELAGTMGVSLLQERGAAQKAALAQELARMLVFASKDFSRRNLPEPYRLMLMEILLSVEDVLVEVTPASRRLVREALSQPPAERPAAVEVAVGEWMLQHLMPKMGVELVVPPELPAYGQAEGSAGPSDLPVGPPLPEPPPGGDLPF